MSSVIIYFIYRKKSWDSSQIFIDVSTIALTLVLAFFTFFRMKTLTDVMTLNPWALLSATNITANILTISTMVAIVLSSTMKHFPIAFKVMIAGVLLYIGSDFMYFFELNYDVYMPNQTLDFTYLMSLVLMISAGLIEIYNPAKGSEDVILNSPPKKDFSKKFHFIFIIPIFLVWYSGYNLTVLIFYFAILGLRLILSYNLKVIRNNTLFEAEKTLNIKLESIIEERTKQLVESNKRLDMLAKKDDLTGLFNRRYFLEYFQLQINAYENQHLNKEMVLFYIDLDYFKTINDTYGHDTGDLILIEIAKRFNNISCEDTLVARMGGDEFTILVKKIMAKTEVEEIARGIIELCCSPIVITPYKFTLSASIGISRYPYDGNSLNILMKNADIAMYYSKDLGRGKYHFYTEILSEQIERKNNVQLALKSADFEKEFEIFYQGQFSVKDKKLIGAEALIRWNNPELGSVSPTEFIPISEETGMIIPIGEWVIKTVFNKIKAWNSKYGIGLRVGINISPKQLDDVNFIPQLETMINSLEINPKWLDLEITENSAMKSEAKMEELLTAMSGLGCSISIDDFGTGYSSLSYIKRYDIDRIKIAKELIDEIVIDINSEKIVHAIILMSKGLGLATIAEGVEYEEQFNKLVELGCDEIQGYLFAKPVTSQEFEEKYLNE